VQVFAGERWYKRKEKKRRADAYHSIQPLTLCCICVGTAALQAVMVCVVDTYLKLGPSLLPYLEGLDSAQLQLVTTYASRLSQARFIAADG